jgi:hypothetical protein
MGATTSIYGYSVGRHTIVRSILYRRFTWDCWIHQKRCIGVGVWLITAGTDKGVGFTLDDCIGNVRTLRNAYGSIKVTIHWTRKVNVGVVLDKFISATGQVY